MARTEAESPGWRQRATKTVVLTVPGERDPEVYLVCSDIFDILGKMLTANRRSISIGNGPRFEYEEVRFLLGLLGALRSVASPGDLVPVDLWISGE